MKSVMLFILAAMLLQPAFSQSEKYVGAMKKNIAAIDSALSKNEFSSLTDIAAGFERIGDAEKTQWLPFYYAAYCRITLAFVKNEVSENDIIADKVDELIAKAVALEKNNSELSLLKAMNTSLRMLVNPMQRWMEFGPKMQQYSQDAMTQDPTNPRPYWFNGVSLKNTPVEFGGGCGNAKPLLDKALELYAGFTPASELHPNWGKQVCEKEVAGCK
ncbi:MAG: hypothetical protein J0M10_10580 [Chitinophagales bacterium]|nr:hypothetical protein [Chitinophagales bacterium]